MATKQGREYRAVQDFSLVPRAEESSEYRVRGTAVVFDTPTVLWEYDGMLSRGATRNSAKAQADNTRSGRAA